MDAQEGREAFKEGDVVLVNGHIAVIVNVDDHGVSFMLSSNAKVDASDPLRIQTLDGVYECEGE